MRYAQLHVDRALADAAGASRWPAGAAAYAGKQPGARRGGASVNQWPRHRLLAPPAAAVAAFAPRRQGTRRRSRMRPKGRRRRGVGLGPELTQHRLTWRTTAGRPLGLRAGRELGAHALCVPARSPRVAACVNCPVAPRTWFLESRRRPLARRPRVSRLATPLTRPWAPRA